MANQFWPIDILTPPHLSSSLTDSLPSLNLLCYSKTDARFMQDGQKEVWSIPYVSVASFFPSLKQNFIAYRSSKVLDCIFEIHQLWQTYFSRVYSNYCCSCSFEAEIITIGQSSHKMYSNNIVNFQDSTTILNTHTKNVWKLIVCTSYPYLSLNAFHIVTFNTTTRFYKQKFGLPMCSPLIGVLTCIYLKFLESGPFKYKILITSDT